MKKTLQALKILIFILTAGIIQAQLTDSENYIYTKTNLSEDGSRKIESVTYFDGLGRPKQNVIVNGAGVSGKDLVTPIKYDDYGRQALDILPVPVQSKTKGYHSGITDESSANSYYSGKGLGGNAYSERMLENSPLDRVMGQYGPGEDWRSNNKKVTYDYFANEDNEVLRFVTTTSWLGGATKSVLSLDSNIYYSKSTLYKNKVTDEDDNVSYEYKNGQGQTLLVRKMLKLTQSADTYYIYNEYDQLAFVLSPLASEAVKNNLSGIDLNEGASTLSELSYQYRYDGRNRLAEKKLPGKGWEYMVYDQQDRLVLTQDANLRVSTNNFGSRGWLFTKYDKFGRVIYTGFFPNSAARSNMQTALDSMQQNAGNNEERTSSATVTLQNMPLYYDNKGFPTGTKTLLSVNYYDTYPAGSPGISGYIQSQPVLTQDSQSSNISTKGLPVASYIKNIEDNNWTKNYNWYDTKARLIGTHSINHLGGYTKTESLLDFSGIPQEVYTYHKRLSTDAEIIIKEKFTYDHQNRLLTHTHQVNNHYSDEPLSINTYDELGRLNKKDVGINDEHDGPLQSIIYQYNIRGWLTGINDVNSLNSSLFAYKIKYQNPDNPSITSARYNGNIAEVDWKTANDGILRRYGYQYDNLNRLIAGKYQKPSAGVVSINAYNEELTYDINGNIMNLQRYGGSDGNQAQLIDDLKYTYNGNKILDVYDVSGNYSGLASGGSMTYDSNGNITIDRAHLIWELKYNYLNLPNRIEKKHEYSEYVYRSDGTKIYKLFYNEDEDIKHNYDYLDGFQYYNNILQFIPTSEGYYDFTKNAYIYQYKDHLGNVRFNYHTADGGGIALLEENNYYPFGLKHEGYNDYYEKSNYQYKYNGKELQETGMYDYGARMYMPDIGRWGVVDPLAETSRRWSTYTYAYNNPIRFIDPDGMQNEDWVKLGSQVFYDASIKSQAAATATYGDTAQHLGEGSKVTTSVNGEVDSQYTLHNDGTASDMAGNTIDNTKDITTKGGTTIFSNCSDCLNPGTLNKNLLGLTYPGGDNPKTYGGDYSYAFSPSFRSEYPAIGHDRRYDNLGTAGASGLLTDTRAIGADYRFVAEELSISVNPFIGTKDRLAAGALGVGLGVAALPKTISALSTNKLGVAGAMLEIYLYYRASSQNVTNTPSK